MARGREEDGEGVKEESKNAGVILLGGGGGRVQRGRAKAGGGHEDCCNATETSAYVGVQTSGGKYKNTS